MPAVRNDRAAQAFSGLCGGASMGTGSKQPHREILQSVVRIYCDDIAAAVGWWKRL